MQFSVVNYQALEMESLRLDAEFYKTVFLNTEKRIKNQKWDYLKNLTATIKSFGAYSLNNQVEYKEEGIPFLRCKDIQNGFINFSNVLFIDETAHKLLSKSEVKPNTVLFTMSGTVGNSAISTEDLNYPINSNQDIAKIKTNEKLNPYYLTVFLNSKYGILQISRQPVGSVQQHIFLWQIEKLETPLFSKKFQLIIEEVFKKSISLIKLSESLYSQAEKLLLEELGLLNWKPKHELSFIKKYTDTKKSDRFDAEYFQPKYEEIVEAVEKYKGGFDKLGNLVKIKKSIEPGSEAYKESGIPFVRVSNLSKFEISDNNQQFISEEFYNQLKNLQPRKGEILLTKDATPGMAYYLNEEPQKMIVSGGILILKINSQKVIPEYLTLVLNSVIVQKQIERDAGGSVINHWRPDQVNATLIPILKDNKQKEIKKLLEKSFNNRQLSKSLLEIAKQGVEMAIEKDEESAEIWINDKVNQLKIDLRG